MLCLNVAYILFMHAFQDTQGHLTSNKMHRQKNQYAKIYKKHYIHLNVYLDVRCSKNVELKALHPIVVKHTEGARRVNDRDRVSDYTWRRSVRYDGAKYEVWI